MYLVDPTAVGSIVQMFSFFTLSYQVEDVPGRSYGCRINHANMMYEYLVRIIIRLIVCQTGTGIDWQIKFCKFYGFCQFC